MTAELFEFDIITLIVSLSAVVVSILAFINARQHAIIESFISIVNAFFTKETRKARRALRKKITLTESRDEKDLNVIDLNILLEQDGLSDDDMNDVWELVSAYNRLAFVLHNYPRTFLSLSLKEKFLKWDSQTVIEVWNMVKPYVDIERKKKERSEVGKEFQDLFDEAMDHQELKEK